MDWENLPKNVEWMRRNVWLAVSAMMFGTLFYAGYSFIGGYASKFGETYASNFSVSFRHSIASYTVVDTMLHTYLTKYNASRISVARFHNSSHDIGSNEIFFVAFENVLARPGVTTDGIAADLPANMFSLVLPRLMNDKSTFLWVKDLPDNALKQKFIANGSKAALFIPINDLSDRLVGMIVMSWMSEPDVPPQNEIDGIIKTMASAADRVGAYFSAKQ